MGLFFILENLLNFKTIYVFKNKKLGPTTMFLFGWLLLENSLHNFF